VYYNLGEFEDALTYALGAGPRFNPNEKSQFVQTLICT
jgi:26S proteasome regulatory subunit N2